MVYILIFIIIPIAFVAVFIYSQQQKDIKRAKENEDYWKDRNEEKEEYAHECDKKYGKCTISYGTTSIINSGFYHDLIRVYEDSQIIVANGVPIHFKDIISYTTPNKTVFGNGNITTETKYDTSNLISRAAVGAVAMGSTGAVIGALTSKTHTKSKSGFDNITVDNLGQVKVTLNLKTISKPYVNIPCYDCEINEICAILNAIISNNEKV